MSTYIGMHSPPELTKQRAVLQGGPLLFPFLCYGMMPAFAQASVIVRTRSTSDFGS